MSPPRVGLVTCEILDWPDPDGLIAPLAALGVEARGIAWDDPSADPGEFDLCVLRSCWNYQHHPEAFRAWLDRAEASTRLLNEPAIARWNLHKGYLSQLAAEGTPIVPTHFVARGEALDLAAFLDEAGWRDLVIKPALSASAWQTRRFQDSPGDAQAFLDELSAERDAMLQPYQRSVEGSGERSLLFIDGVFSHSVRKAPMLGGERGPEPAAPAEPDMLDLARRILARFDAPPLYARVDLIRGDHGRALLSELELLEPSMFLDEHPPARQAFARAIAGRLG